MTGLGPTGTSPFVPRTSTNPDASARNVPTYDVDKTPRFIASALSYTRTLGVMNSGFPSAT